jgi:hypothetical protein
MASRASAVGHERPDVFVHDVVERQKMATMEKFHFRRALDPEGPDVCVEYRWID